MHWPLFSAPSRPVFSSQFSLSSWTMTLAEKEEGSDGKALGWAPTSCVLVFQGKLSAVASLWSRLPSPQIPFLNLKKWFCQPQEKPLAQEKPGPRSCHQTPLSASWDSCQGLGSLAGDVERPCSDPICSELTKKPDLLLLPFPLQPQALWMSGFSEMKN